MHLCLIDAQLSGLTVAINTSERLTSSHACCIIDVLVIRKVPPSQWRLNQLSRLVYGHRIRAVGIG